jgi:hypothetical protein
MDDGCHYVRGGWISFRVSEVSDSFASWVIAQKDVCDHSHGITFVNLFGPIYMKDFSIDTLDPFQARFFVVDRSTSSRLLCNNRHFHAPCATSRAPYACTITSVTGCSFFRYESACSDGGRIAAIGQSKPPALFCVLADCHTSQPRDPYLQTFDGPQRRRSYRDVLSAISFTL